MTVSFTIHLWHVLLYVGLGVLSVPVLMYLGWKHLAKYKGRPTFIERQQELIRMEGWQYVPRLALLVALWPVGWWEALR